jgi:hypothetical protein
MGRLLGDSGRDYNDRDSSSADTLTRTGEGL